MGGAGITGAVVEFEEGHAAGAGAFGKTPASQTAGTDAVGLSGFESVGTGAGEGKRASGGQAVEVLHVGAAGVVGLRAGGRERDGERDGGGGGGGGDGVGHDHVVVTGVGGGDGCEGEGGTSRAGNGRSVRDGTIDEGDAALAPLIAEGGGAAGGDGERRVVAVEKGGGDRRGGDRGRSGYDGERDGGARDAAHGIGDDDIVRAGAGVGGLDVGENQRGRGGGSVAGDVHGVLAPLIREGRGAAGDDREGGAGAGIGGLRGRRSRDRGCDGGGGREG